MAGIVLVGVLLAPLAPGAPSVRAGEPVSAVPARASAAPVAIARIAWHGPRTDRVVALTFDDGWNPRTLRQVYQVLVREHVPATFFVTGVYVQRAPDLWRRIAASGYPLANHSYLHRDARRLTPRQLAIDVVLTREAVEAATGRPMLPAFRPPYGSRTPATDAVVAAAGFENVVMWDVSAGDTVGRPTVARVVRDASAGRPGSIVLLHAGPTVTPRALPRIIARYRARGFRFVTLEELLGIRARPMGEGIAAAAASRQLDRIDPDGGAASRPPGAVEAIPPTAPPAAAPAAADLAPAPAPPARDGAWARRAGTPASVALFTAVLLGLLLLAAAAAGRGRSTPDDAPPDAGAMTGDRPG